MNLFEDTLLILSIIFLIVGVSIAVIFCNFNSWLFLSLICIALGSALEAMFFFILNN